MSWRETLASLLDTGTFATQGDLVRALAAAGHPVTQATVSRELAAIGARKVRGAYRQPPPPSLPAPVLSVAVAAGGGVAVVTTLPAHASVLAQAIDDAALKGVLGTIAGDNTVFVALAGTDAAAALRRLLRGSAQEK